jgi:hypothetical protein
MVVPSGVMRERNAMSYDPLASMAVPSGTAVPVPTLDLAQGLLKDFEEYGLAMVPEILTGVPQRHDPIHSIGRS